MEGPLQSVGSHWPWLIAGAMSASAGATLVPKPAPPSPAALVTAAVGPAAAPAEAKPVELEARGRRLGGATRALELLADHLGVDAGYRERARATRALHSRRSGPPPADTWLGVGQVAALDLKDSAGQRHRDTLLRQSEAEDYERWLLRVVKERARSARLNVQFVVALMPDYVDSNSAWMFDSYLDAVQRAAGATQFVLDRFHLPDWAPEKGAQATSADRRAHEVEPGAVLFRNTRRPEDPKDPSRPGNASRDEPKRIDLLMVLIPTETATSGIHAAAFLSAAALASDWRQTEPLRLLGPSFSGSTPSLVRLLKEARRLRLLPKPGSGVAVRIVAGSASAQLNQTLLQDDTMLKGAVEFHSTSASDRDYLVALRDHLGGINESWRLGEGIALLIEGNTGWGQILSSRMEEASRADPAGAPRADPLAKRDCREGGEKRVFPCAQQLTFPLHISRLRGAAAARGRGDADTYSSAVSLELEEILPPSDQLPALTPGITSATTEATLGRLLDSLDRLDVSAVGIFATDKRDHLFLAQEIARRSANVQLFALESSLIYLHPDFRPYLRGTLVASPSPLFNLTQVMAGRPNARRLHQFPNSAAATVYNAFLALLDRPERMLDYGAACGRGKDPLDRLADCAPSVWLGLVGQNDIWPLRRIRPDPKVNQGYSWPGEKGAFGKEPPRSVAATTAKWPRAMLVLVAGLALVLLTHGLVGGGVLAALAGHDGLRRILPILEPPLARARRLSQRAMGASEEARAKEEQREAAMRQEYWLSILACGGALWAVTTWLGGLAEAGRGTLEAGGADLPLSAVRWLGTGGRRDLLGVALALGAAAALWPTSARRRGGFASLTLLRVAPVAAGLYAMFALRSVFMDAGSVFAGELGGLNALRAASFDAFVSPSPAVLLLAGVAYTWGVWNLRRVHLQAVGFPDDSPVLELLSGGLCSVKQDLVEALNDPGLRVCSACSVALLLFVAAPLVLCSRSGHSLDGKAMGAFLLWGTAFGVFLMGHTLAHCARLGTSLLSGLRTLNLHPLGAAFTRVAREPFVLLSSKVTDGRMLVPLVRQAGAVATAFHDIQWPEDKQKTGSVPSWPEIVDREAFARDLCANEPFQATGTWARLEKLAAPLARILERGAWARRPYPTEPGGAAEWQREAETFLALHVACALRHVLARLLSGLSLALVGLALILGAHLFYVFQGRALWLTVDWIYLGLGTALAVLFLVRLEKDAVLSRLWSTQPGRVDWSGALVKRMVLYGALPVVTLFASFFPEVGQSILAWIEPVKKVLP